jgi:ribosomal protein S21
MAINADITRKKNENNLSVLKRFTRRVQSAGVLPKVRSLRYETRTPSQNVRKKQRLESLTRKAKIDDLIKLGKISQVQTRKRRR